MAVRATVTAPETRTGNNYLRGCIPVAEGFAGSLFLRSPAGVALATEQYVGIRGPGDVTRTLELRAYGSSPGGSQTYTVEDGTVASALSFHDHQTFTLLSEAPDTEASPSTVTFSSRLLQGGVGSNTGDAGDVTRTIMRSGELVASSGSRLYGWRAYITTVAGEPDVWLVDMAVQNANVGTPGNPLGASGILHDLFFNEIRLSMPAGYSLTHLHKTPYTTTTKLMAPDPGGVKLHGILQGGAKLYRFAIHTAATAGRASVLLNGFGWFVCDQSTSLWSWNNPETPWYGPHARAVPDIDLSSYDPYTSSYSTIVSGLLSGVSFDTGEGVTAWTTPLGPYHVNGPTHGGYGSSAYVTAFRGYEVANGASISKLKAHMAMLGMIVDRAASNVSPGDTGVFVCDSNQAPIRPGDWDLSNVLIISAPGKLNSNHQGPWPRLNANQWRLTHAATNNLLPGYYGQLGSFNLYSDSHLIRAAGPCVPLIWLLNDPLAKDYMAHLSLWGRLHTLEYGPSDPNLADDAGSLWYSYEGADDNVQVYPGKGARKSSELSGRIGGWAIFTHSTDWLATDDNTKRSDAAPWFTMLKAHHTLAQMQVASRNWHAMDSSSDTPVQQLIEQYNENGHAGDPDAAAAQATEVGIHAGALLCVHACTGDDDWLAMLANGCAGMFDFHWKPGSDAPYFVAPVRPRTDLSLDAWATPVEAPDCFYKPSNTDHYQVGTLAAAAFAHDPAHPQAWDMLYAFTGTSTPEDALAELLSIDTLKLESSWGPVLSFLQDFTSDAGVTVTPPPAVITLVAVDPESAIEVEITPPPAIIELVAVNGPRTGMAVDFDPAIIELVAVEPTVSAPYEVTPPPAIIEIAATMPSATVAVIVTPPSAVVEIVAVPPWNLEGEGFNATLGIRQTVADTLAAVQYDAVTSEARQSVQATLAIEV